jgi:hypothetical protein
LKNKIEAKGQPHSSAVGVNNNNNKKEIRATENKINNHELLFHKSSATTKTLKIKLTHFSILRRKK